MTDIWVQKALQLIDQSSGQLIICEAMTFIDSKDSALAENIIQFVCHSENQQSLTVILYAEKLNLTIRKHFRSYSKHVIFLKNSMLINRSLSAKLYIETIYQSLLAAAKLRPGTRFTLFIKNIENTRHLLQNLYNASLQWELEAFGEGMKITFSS